MLHIDNITSIFCWAIIIVVQGPKLIVSDFSQIEHQIMDKKKVLS